MVHLGQFYNYLFIRFDPCDFLKIRLLRKGQKSGGRHTTQGGRQAIHTYNQVKIFSKFLETLRCACDCIIEPCGDYDTAESES